MDRIEREGGGGGRCKQVRRELSGGGIGEERDGWVVRGVGG